MGTAVVVTGSVSILPTGISSAEQFGALIVVLGASGTPAYRVFMIQAENRVFAVEAESRTFAVQQENRVFGIEQ
jgi:hypothetical protein